MFFLASYTQLKYQLFYIPPPHPIQSPSASSVSPFPQHLSLLL